MSLHTLEYDHFSFLSALIVPLKWPTPAINYRTGFIITREKKTFPSTGRKSSLTFLTLSASHFHSSRRPNSSSVTEANTLARHNSSAANGSLQRSRRPCIPTVHPPPRHNISRHTK